MYLGENSEDSKSDKNETRHWLNIKNRDKGNFGIHLLGFPVHGDPLWVSLLKSWKRECDIVIFYAVCEK